MGLNETEGGFHIWLAVVVVVGVVVAAFVLQS